MTPVGPCTCAVEFAADSFDRARQVCAIISRLSATRSVEHSGPPTAFTKRSISACQSLRLSCSSSGLSNLRIDTGPFAVIFGVTTTLFLLRLGFASRFLCSENIYPENKRVCLLAREACGVECHASFASYERPRDEPLLAGEVLPTRLST